MLAQLTFNDLRDNEARGARHKQRTATRLQALSISSLTSNFEPTPQVEVNTSDLSKLRDVHCRPTTFDPTAFGCSGANIDPGDIVRQREGWSATNPQTLALNQQSLCSSLLHAEEDAWPNLWLASCFRSHMVVSSENKHYYVVMATKWLVLAYELYNIQGVFYVTCEVNCFRIGSSLA